MKSWLRSIGLVAFAVLTFAACGDDSSTTGAGGTGGSGGTGGTAGTGGTGGSGGSGATDGGDPGEVRECTTVFAADKIEYTGTAAPASTCDGNKSTKYPDGPNACRNTADCEMINTGMVRELVRECGLSCRGNPINCPMETTCNQECVKSATSMKIKPPGISDACGKCYTDITLCSRAFCLSECVASADAIDCVKCQFINGCRVPFEKCSGLDRQ